MQKTMTRSINIVIGLAVFILITLFIPQEILAREASIALATMALMIYWWITKPVHLAVTALLPIVVTAIFNLVPINTVLDDYASQILVLLIGANILTLVWGLTNLDKRIALKALILIGTSNKQQLVVWFLLSTALSTVLPNAVVAATLCPIALAMLNNVGFDEKVSKMRNWILLAIVWGAGFGGFGTPLGGAMNLVTITHIENFLGTEYIYGTWVTSMAPYLLIVSLGLVGFFMLINTGSKKLAGSKEFFKESYKKLGKLRKEEIIALALFFIAIALAFMRPLYANILPAFKPPYAFLLLGLVAFFLPSGKKDKKQLIDFKYAAKNINWGLMMLFSGGLAIGNLLIATNATTGIADMIININISGKFGLMVVFVLIGMFLANTSSNTAACAILVPIVISITSGLNYDPIPFVYVSAAACNCAYLLPTSVRAIPVSYGMDTKFMLEKGIYGVLISFLLIVGVGSIILFVI